MKHVFWELGNGSVGWAVASYSIGHDSNPVIGKIYIECLLSTVLKRRNKKCLGMAQLKPASGTIWCHSNI